MPSEFKPAHILVVDDDADIRATLKAALTPEGFRVSEAQNGRELMEAVSAAVPDLITLDLNLAGAYFRQKLHKLGQAGRG